MGAPTVSGEETLRQTMEEYGVSAAELGLATTDEEAEDALLDVLGEVFRLPLRGPLLQEKAESGVTQGHP